MAALTELEERLGIRVVPVEFPREMLSTPDALSRAFDPTPQSPLGVRRKAESCEDALIGMGLPSRRRPPRGRDAESGEEQWDDGGRAMAGDF